MRAINGSPSSFIEARRFVASPFGRSCFPRKPEYSQNDRYAGQPCRYKRRYKEPIRPQQTAQERSCQEAEAGARSQKPEHRSAQIAGIAVNDCGIDERNVPCARPVYEPREKYQPERVGERQHEEAYKGRRLT